MSNLVHFSTTVAFAPVHDAALIVKEGYGSDVSDRGLFGTLLEDGKHMVGIAYASALLIQFNLVLLNPVQC